MDHRPACKTSHYTTSGRNLGEKLYDLRFDEFLAITPKEKIYTKLDFTKIKNFYSLKDTVKVSHS